uniref:Protein kinase domain-containing protein n=1 Tax=Corethron hystrix TaxID=216773 RepID=A0A7S1BHD3_9STRA|mmetsp:Transcript_26202/g.60252  ORF Transcript_26202/g.60252 Transcript_26202/m.60252 type:complete len:519 (+) Transcript_26202:3-1559(+)
MGRGRGRPTLQADQRRSGGQGDLERTSARDIVQKEQQHGRMDTVKRNDRKSLSKTQEAASDKSTKIKEFKASSSALTTSVPTEEKNSLHKDDQILEDDIVIPENLQFGDSKDGNDDNAEESEADCRRRERKERLKRLREKYDNIKENTEYIEVNQETKRMKMTESEDKEEGGSAATATQDAKNNLNKENISLLPEKMANHTTSPAPRLAPASPSSPALASAPASVPTPAPAPALVPAPSDDNDSFDMFSSSPLPAAKKATPSSNNINQKKITGAPHLADNWTDAEGYYKCTPGELLADRYRAEGAVGRGVFSSVIRAVDTFTNATVAVKVARANETMAKAAGAERDVLRRLSKGGKGGEATHTGVLRLLDACEHVGHQLLVFPYAHMNLRECLHKFGRNVGLNVSAVGGYARQLFRALCHLRRHRVIHADIKPDNILVSEDYSCVVLCDFGNAYVTEEDGRSCDITPYLASRFYRPPEVVLGLEYDYGVDLWGVAVTLHELFTGRVTFPGVSNNGHLD